MKKVLIVTGDGAEALEVMYPFQRLLEAGHKVTLASPTAKVIRTVVHDFEPGFETYTEKWGYQIKTDIGFADVIPENYDALLLPGGRAPEYIRNNPDCQRIVKHFFETQKPVAAICHAALILIACNLLKGYTCTAYPALKPDVEGAGATYKDAEVVVNRNLISSRAWPDHPAFLREFISLL